MSVRRPAVPEIVPGTADLNAWRDDVLSQLAVIPRLPWCGPTPCGQGGLQGEDMLSAFDAAHEDAHGEMPFVYGTDPLQRNPAYVGTYFSGTREPTRRPAAPPAAPQEHAIPPAPVADSGQAEGPTDRVAALFASVNLARKHGPTPQQVQLREFMDRRRPTLKPARSRERV